MSLNVCIFGVSGYTGSKLLEYLCKHKNVKILGVFGKKSKGIGLEKLFPNIDNLPKIKISDYREFKFDNVDLIFSCLPHGEFQNSVINNLDPKIAIIDLSGDFRLKSAKDYEKFYKIKHKSPNFLKKFTYGLSEINKKEIVNSKFISNPGCYPTSILLPLIPLLKNNMIDKSHIVIDSKSGISGAGKKPKNILYSVFIYSLPHAWAVLTIPRLTQPANPQVVTPAPKLGGGGGVSSGNYLGVSSFEHQPSDPRRSRCSVRLTRSW